MGAADNWRDRAACIDEDPELFATNDREGMSHNMARKIRQERREMSA